MTLRNASGKFSLPSFGRHKDKSNADGAAVAPQSRQSSTTYPSAGGHTSGAESEPGSPRVADSMAGAPSMMTATSGGSGGGGGGGAGAFDGIGSKLGKRIAHTSFLPSLGNQDLRPLQDVITAEKAIVSTTDRMSGETAQAAGKLPLYGQAEGPDLQDVLTHSSTLLNQLSAALRTFSNHEASMRLCFKRIREREEQLDEMRRRRRTTGTKAESAERKLAKMGPENKQLPAQTDLLERLRSEMRQQDSDIVHEETKLGDFKRQTVKEAMSYKFGGLEELGEKMCIIGELGKLLLEEIPLEETPPGYGRAPYTAHERTESTTKEAIKCLATVQFHAASAAPKPPGLPQVQESGSFSAPSLPRQNSRGMPYPAGQQPLESPMATGARDTGPPQLPALGTSAGAVGSGNLGSGDYSDLHTDESHPEHNHARATFGDFGAMAPVTSPTTPPGTVGYKGDPSVDDSGLDVHDYEYQQQREMDQIREQEEREAREAAEHHEAEAPGTRWSPSTNSHELPELPAADAVTITPAHDEAAGEHSQASWQPLRVENRRSMQGQGVSLSDMSGPGYTLPALSSEPLTFTSDFLAMPGEQQPRDVNSPSNSAYFSADERNVATPRSPETHDSTPSTNNRSARYGTRALDSVYVDEDTRLAYDDVAASLAYDGLDHDPLSTTPGAHPTAAAAAQTQPALEIPPPKHEALPETPDPIRQPEPEPEPLHDYSDESTPVVTIPAEHEIAQHPVSRYIPSIPPPTASELGTHDAPSSVRGSYLESEYQHDPSRDSYEPSFGTRDSYAPPAGADAMSPRQSSYRESYNRASNGSLDNSAAEAHIMSVAPPAPAPAPASSSGTGVMSAAAFRRAVKPRASYNDSAPRSPTTATSGYQPPSGPRRLPVPPIQSPSQGTPTNSYPSPGGDVPPDPPTYEAAVHQP